MPIRRYVEEGVFSADALSAMSKAFETAIWTLGIGTDETKREAVARFIVRSAQRDGHFDAASFIVWPSRNSAVVRPRPRSSIPAARRRRPREAQGRGARGSRRRPMEVRQEPNNGAQGLVPPTMTGLTGVFHASILESLNRAAKQVRLKLCSLRKTSRRTRPDGF